MRVGLLSILVLAACGGGAGSECKSGDPKSCPAGLVCEPVTGKDKPLCFAPVQLKGTVTVLGTTTPVANAEVTAVDLDGAPVGLVAKSANDGTYAVSIPSTRSDLKGTPVGKTVTLRAAAQDFIPFPSGIRVSGTFDTSADKAPPPDVALIAVTDAEKGRPGVTGTVELAAGEGALVVLEGAGRAWATDADSSGAFHLLNVVPGTYKAQAYRKGLNFTSVDVTVASGADSTGVALKKSGGPAATVSGTLSGGTAGAAVQLVVESTYSDALGRGEVLAGLKTDRVSGAWSLSGVPDGKYVVVPSLDNDSLVRTPGPASVHVTVTGGAAVTAAAVSLSTAVGLLSPGAAGIDQVTAPPTFTWVPFGGPVTSYEVVVFSSEGVKVWENLAVGVIPNGDSNIIALYGGTALKTGAIYQWRATAKGAAGPLSVTEDLKGVFQVK